MRAGQQSTGLNFWDHGSMVAARYRDLMNANPCMTWRYPSWFEQNADWIRERLKPDFTDIQTYQQWHDAGKPYCREVDADGKMHYPNHAAVSAQIWNDLGGSPAIGDLIRDDMLCHTLKPADAAAFAANPNALVLLITALCELHANASMFGGISSDSFKIKFKRLEKCGNIIMSHLKDQS